MCWLVKYLQTSGDRVIFRISLLEDWNVFALSDCIVAGNPRLLANLWKPNRKSCTFNPQVSSRWTALVVAHMNIQTYTLSWLCSPRSTLERFPLTYSGLAKSRPVCENGGSSETQWFGKSANCGVLHVAISYLCKQCNVVKSSSLSLVHVKPKIVLSRWSVLQWCLNVLPDHVLV